MKPDLPEVELALEATRQLMTAAQVDWLIVGGMAVIHHGYERLTVDVDVLLTAQDGKRLDPLLGRHGFGRIAPHRLVHEPSGVRVDLLLAGSKLPGRRGGLPLPAPHTVAASPSDPRVIGLTGLCDLKLDAGRRQDLADVVALLKHLDDGAYLHLESTVRPDHRPALAGLRTEALEEAEWEAAVDG